MIGLGLLLPFFFSSHKNAPLLSSVSTLLSSSSSSSKSPPPPPAVIPITVLSGFLGAGKTTLLRNLLVHNNGKKIAIIVNDVASVNIDSKLLTTASSSSSQSSQEGGGSRPAGFVQLSNGCACCSMSDQLLTSVSELVTLSDLKDPQDSFDHIVIELSGVSEPRAVRANFQNALQQNMPLMERVRFDTMVTLIDCSSFLQHLQSHLPNTALPQQEDEEEDTSFSNLDNDDDDEIPLKLLEALQAASNKYDPKSGNDDDNNNNEEEAHFTATVGQLLVQQTECADVILLNKIDLIHQHDELNTLSLESSLTSSIDTIQAIVTALNPTATVYSTSYGRLDSYLDQVLGVAQGLGIASEGIVDEHRDAVGAALTLGLLSTTTVATPTTTTWDDASIQDITHSPKSHSHNHDHHASYCQDPHCNDPSHHSNTSSSTTTTSNVADATNKDSVSCNDPTHSHSHSHEHSSTCQDISCKNPTHSHSHMSDHTSTTTTTSNTLTSCEDPNCTNPTHTHVVSTIQNKVYSGISSFVYRARRPFHPQRLSTFLQLLPIQHGLPTTIATVTNDDSNNNNHNNTMTVESFLPNPTTLDKICKNIIRSKGFTWMANSHVAAYYWSHAGTSFEMQCLGRWWSTIPRLAWPEESKEIILSDFDSMDHEEYHSGDESKKEYQNLKSFGDRRQEVVLIGNGMNDKYNQQVLEQSLNACLLNNNEMIEYIEILLNNSYMPFDYDAIENRMKQRFPSPLAIRFVEY